MEKVLLMSVPVCDEQTQYKDITTEAAWNNVNNNLKETDVIAIESLQAVMTSNFSLANKIFTFAPYQYITGHARARQSAKPSTRSHAEQRPPKSKTASEVYTTMSSPNTCTTT